MTCKDCNTPIAPGEQWGESSNPFCATCAESVERQSSDSGYQSFLEWIQSPIEDWAS